MSGDPNRNGEFPNLKQENPDISARPSDADDSSSGPFIETPESNNFMLAAGLVGPDGDYNPADGNFLDEGTSAITESTGHVDRIEGNFLPETKDAAREAIEDVRKSIRGDLAPLLFKDLPKAPEPPAVIEDGGRFHRDIQFEDQMFDEMAQSRHAGVGNYPLDTEEVEYLRKYLEDGMLKGVEASVELTRLAGKKAAVTLNRRSGVAGFMRHVQAKVLREDLSAEKELRQREEVYRETEMRRRALEGLDTGHNNQAIIQLLVEKLNGYINDFNEYHDPNPRQSDSLYERRAHIDNYNRIVARAPVEHELLERFSKESAATMRQGSILDIRARRELFGDK
jgi:hypothetical protein